MIVILAACVRLVAQHHPRPLVVAHRRGAAVREQIHIDAVGGHVKQIVAGRPEQPIPLLPRRPTDWLHHLDLERLRWELHGLPSRIVLLNRANCAWNGFAPSYSNTYLVISNRDDGFNSRITSGCQVI